MKQTQKHALPRALACLDFTTIAEPVRDIVLAFNWTYFLLQIAGE
jgi:hypothetical protein